MAHVHGGDRAAGLVDDSLRHAVTKLAHVHFPATDRSAHRVRRLGEQPWRIHTVGAPGIDGIAVAAAPWTGHVLSGSNLGSVSERHDRGTNQTASTSWDAVANPTSGSYSGSVSANSSTAGAAAIAIFRGPLPIGRRRSAFPPQRARNPIADVRRCR